MNAKRLLIVDDEALVRSMLKEALGELGYEAMLAEDGCAGLKLLEREKVQVMLFDLKMPGMNGVELCREVKRRYPGSVVYAMSGHRSLFDLVDCLAAGFEDYFPKPFDFAVIAKEIEHAFAKLARWTQM